MLLDGGTTHYPFCVCLLVQMEMGHIFSVLIRIFLVLSLWLFEIAHFLILECHARKMPSLLTILYYTVYNRNDMSRSVDENDNYLSMNANYLWDHESKDLDRPYNGFRMLKYYVC